MIELLLGGWDNIRSHYTKEQNMVTLSLRKVDCIGGFSEEYFLPGNFKTRIRMTTKNEFIILQMEAISNNEYSMEERFQMEELIQEKGKRYYFQVLKKNSHSDQYEILLRQQTNAKVPIHIRQNWVKYIKELEQEINIDKNLDDYYKIIRPTIEFTKKLEENLNVLVEAHYKAKNIGKIPDQKVILYAPSSISGLEDLCMYSDNKSQEVNGIVIIDQV